MNEKKAAYDKEYQKLYVKQVNVPFNANNDTDNNLFEWLNQQGNKTAYIKALIEKDMKRRGR